MGLSVAHVVQTDTSLVVIAGRLFMTRFSSDCSIEPALQRTW